MVGAGGELSSTAGQHPTPLYNSFGAQKLRIATGQMAAAGDVQTFWERDTSEKRAEA